MIRICFMCGESIDRHSLEELEQHTRFLIAYQKDLIKALDEERIVAHIVGLDPVETAAKDLEATWAARKTPVPPDPAPPGSLTAEEERTDGQAPLDDYDSVEDAAHDAAQEGFNGQNPYRGGTRTMTHRETELRKEITLLEAAIKSALRDLPDQPFDAESKLAYVLEKLGRSEVIYRGGRP